MKKPHLSYFKRILSKNFRKWTHPPEISKRDFLENEAQYEKTSFHIFNSILREESPVVSRFRVQPV